MVVLHVGLCESRILKLEYSSRLIRNFAINCRVVTAKQTEKTRQIVAKMDRLVKKNSGGVFMVGERQTSQAAQSRCTVVRPIQKSIGKWEIGPPVKS